jgi:hypothetical protein
MNKANRIRIINWCKKFTQVANNIEWRKNRNLHAIYLLDMLINKRLEEPYSKMPDDGPLPILSKTVIKSKLSSKFWEKTKYIYEPNEKDNNNLQNEKNFKRPNTSVRKNKKISNNISLDNSNNGRRQKLDKKKAKTPIMKNNIRYFDENKINNIEKYHFNDDDFLENVNSKYNKELEILRETAIKLEEKLDENQKIIERQEKEKIQLKNEINKLTELLKSIISNDKI